MTKKKNYDSDFCGNLPLNHINSIQSYGFLIVLDINRLTVIQASENLSEITGFPVREFVNTSIEEYVDGESFSRIQSLLQLGVKNRIPLNLALGKEGQFSNFQALMHVKPDYLILELEKGDQNPERSFTAVFQEIKYIISAIEEASTVQQVCEIAIHQLRKISGFDGILMYKFDEEWNGTVVAEEKDEKLEVYIGQTFPASDVPKQARQLYLKNPYRLIPNREFIPVRLYPVINPLTNAFIDLSDCNLRSVAGVHLEYMKNMGIKSSMSIRVIYNGLLWGLISCHHIEEKYLNFEMCSVFEWLSAVISSRITLILDKEEFDFANELQRKRTVLTDLVYAEEDISNALLKEDKDSLLELFSATGALVSLNGRIQVAGQIPGKDALENLMLWLEGKNLSQVFFSNHLIGIYEDAADFSETGSGILVIPIDGKKGDFVICFRPEVVEDINWGGNPNEAINFEKDGKSYHPRNSFKMWKQTVRQHSLSWRKQEIEVAESLRSFLFEFRIKQLYN